MGLTLSSSSVESEQALKIKNLEAELKSLKEDNVSLRKQIVNMIALRAIRDSGQPEPSQVSVVHVEQFVEKLLADSTTNLSFVPDAIERAMEKNMLLFLLKAVAHAVDTASIQLMDHEIVMHMRPIAKGVEVPKSPHIPDSQPSELEMSFEESAVKIGEA